MPAPNLPQPVFLPKRFKLYDVRMIPHREHDDDEHSVAFPLSPRRHSLVVPCHRRFSFPADRPAATNFPRASTDARYASYFAMEVECPMTLYTRRTIGQGVWCRHEVMNWSATLLKVSCILGTSIRSGALFSAFEVQAGPQKWPFLTALPQSRQPFFDGLEGAEGAPPAAPAFFACWAQVLPQKEWVVFPSLYLGCL